MPSAPLLLTLLSVAMSPPASGAPLPGINLSLLWSDPPLTLLQEPFSGTLPPVPSHLQQPLPRVPPPPPLAPEPVHLWPDASVPYELLPRFNRRDHGEISRAFAAFQHHTCLRLIPRSTEADFVRVSPGPTRRELRATGGTAGCAVFVGRQGCPQELHLGAGCVNAGTIAHELMHVIGFHHEQARPDRDRFVTIRWENVRPEKRRWFQRRRWADHGEGTRRLPYDYQSIMHYRPRDFEVAPGRPTIVPRRAGVKVGRGKWLTRMDVIKINVQYRCERDPAGYRRPLVPVPRYRP